MLTAVHKPYPIETSQKRFNSSFEDAARQNYSRLTTNPVEFWNQDIYKDGVRVRIKFLKKKKLLLQKTIVQKSH